MLRSIGENGDSTLFLEEKIGCCPHFPPDKIYVHRLHQGGKLNDCS